MSQAGRKLREQLERSEPVIAVGAHSPLSAKLVEEAGFDVIWASGFEISAAHAVPDANILTMAEQLNVAKIMARAVDIPVIADCDNGYGNAINVIRTVQDYEADGIAGICMEDNIFPKRCSFYAGVKRELVTPEEHAGKIRAACEARRSKDFVIIARTEAFIAGWGMDEAKKRAHAYADAGADMILVHSKSPDFDELKAFAESWDRPAKLVAVPTIYNKVSANELNDAGFKLVIFANHGLRTTIKSMRETFRILMEEQRTIAVEDQICSLQEVYDIIGVPKMRSDEKVYMPAGADKVTAVILAAGDSKALGTLTDDKPKTMLEIRGQSILERQIGALNACGISDIAVIRGYKKETINVPGVRYYDNDDWSDEGELYSLIKAEAELDGRMVVLYGDIIFDPGILEKLLKSEGDISVVVDRAWCDTHESKTPEGPKPDLVQTETQPAQTTRFVPGAADKILKIGRGLNGEATGEFVGMLMLSPEGTTRFTDTFRQVAESDSSDKFHEADSFRKSALTDFIQELVNRGEKVHSVDIYKGWSEVDTFEDYQKAWGSSI